MIKHESHRSKLDLINNVFGVFLKLYDMSKAKKVNRFFC